MRWAVDNSERAISFDGEFRIHSVSEAPGDVLKCSDKEEQAASAAGCFYMSGSRQPMQVVWSDGDSNRVFMITRVMGRLVGEELESHVESGATGVCGPICSMPGKLSELCSGLKTQRVYACPLVEGLPALGKLVCSMPDKSVVKVDLRKPLKGDREQECQIYDVKLDGDAEGRMADLVARGMSVLNVMYDSPYVEAFFGRVLSFNELGDSVYLMRSIEVDKWFGAESILVKKYAATTVPVEVSNTEKFELETGYSSEKVKIMVSSGFGYTRSMSDFMRFLKVMSGRGWVVSSDPGNVTMDRGVPAFMHDGACRMGADNYREMYHAG